jgi:hypothetical protein
MFMMEEPPRTVGAARVVIVTTGRPALLDDTALLRALSWRCSVERADGGGRGAARTVAGAVRRGAELVHLLDASLLPLAPRLRRLGVPLTATLSRPLDESERRLVPCLDEVFIPVDAFTGQAPKRLRWPAASFVPPVAPEPRDPGDALRGASRALRDIEPGRLVVAALWPLDVEASRVLLDGVLPALRSAPVCLLVGAPGRREARRRIGRRPAPALRLMRAPVSLATISAVARCVDAWIAPEGEACSPDELLSMAASGAPLVVVGGASVLTHEREAFVAPAGEPHALAPLLDRLLALPAAQRHCLGVEFARSALHRWSPDAAAEAYATRFASLVGRPAIPADLRAA